MERSSRMISGSGNRRSAMLMAMFAGIGLGGQTSGHAMSRASQSLAPSVREPSMPPSRKPVALRTDSDLAKLDAAQAKRVRKAARHVELVARGAFDDRRSLVKGF